MLKISILRKSNKAEKEKNTDLRNNKQTSQKQRQNCDPDSDSKDRYV